MKRPVKAVGSPNYHGGAAAGPLLRGVPTLDEIWELAPERCTADEDYRNDWYDNAPARRINYEGGE